MAVERLQHSGSALYRKCFKYTKHVYNRGEVDCYVGGEV